MIRIQIMVAAFAVSHATVGLAQSTEESGGPTNSSTVSVDVSAAQLFAWADEARSRRDFETAERFYRALAENPDIELRTEARFRLALMLADDLNRHAQAAIELRRILDEKPNVARVRLELARMQAMLGNLGAARRELRAAEAAGLPPAVEQLVARCPHSRSAA